MRRLHLPPVLLNMLKSSSNALNSLSYIVCRWKIYAIKLHTSITELYYFETANHIVLLCHRTPRICFVALSYDLKLDLEQSKMQD